MSNGRYKSLLSLAERVSGAIDKGNINFALRLVHDFVERIITEPLCTSQVYGSKPLDDLCQHIGKTSLAEIKRENEDATYGQQGRPVFIYIVTKLQESGGHTRLIEGFIKAQPEGQHVILSTELDGRSDSDYLINGLAKQADIVFKQAPKVNYQQRLTWLQKQLLEIRPVRVYLFNHHQDSVAVAAIQPEMNLDASFYHHGDHHLCLGVHLSHLEHIDPHPMGYHNCRDVLGIENCFIPLAVNDKGCRPNGLPFMADGILTTCTAARSNKIESPYFISYLDVIPDLLRITGGRHIHIGRLTPWALFKIRRGLRRNLVPHDHFVYIPWVRSVWSSLREFGVDLYIASFPYGGGLTLIEAMGAGVPVALHKHITSRILSGFDLAYPEAFSWRYPEELIDFCTSVMPETLKLQSCLARTQYEKFHRPEIFEAALADPSRLVAPPNRPESFTPEVDEWACWMESQLSLGRVMHRGAYRLFRFIRARLF